MGAESCGGRTASEFGTEKETHAGASCARLDSTVTARMLRGVGVFDFWRFLVHIDLISEMSRRTFGISLSVFSEDPKMWNFLKVEISSFFEHYKDFLDFFSASWCLQKRKMTALEPGHVQNS